MIVKGQKINDRYEVIKTIGEGGMANVYLARDVILDRNVAVKVLRGDLSTDEKFVRRFQREALSASSLSHPNIVEIYDVGEDDGNYYIVMEYIDGKNLKQLLKKRGNLTVSEVIDIMLQITSAMSVAHDSLIIHRDLKPQNILIKEDGEIKITDFGIAMALNATHLTQTNSAMGSVHYFPPEQASGKGATLKSDVYSLGIMMFELLTGELPFRGDNAVEIALKHLKEPIPSVRSINNNIPQSVENIIITATAKNAKNRYNNANEMHEDLLTCLNKERLNEPKRTLKYDEGISDVVTITNNKNIDDSIVSQIKEKDEDSNKKLIIFGGILLGLISILAIVFFVAPMLTEVPDVKIPDVSKWSVIDAETELKKLGFEVNPEVEKESSKEVEEGLVIRTSPAGGRTVKKGTEITLIVSTGEVVYTVEDLTGKNYIAVKTELEKVYNLNVLVEEKEVENTTDKKYDDQEIIGQSVEKGKELSSGDEITIYIPKILEKYPDFKSEGWSVSKIEKWASEKGIILTVEETETTLYPEGTIISQSRGVDSYVTSGATLKIVVAKKPVDIEPPATDNPPTDDSSDEDNQ
ncbi:MAG: Stk1 family PASTA domain-containing Ser/Thr kinase [bacterium]|nr:Stk1 family PASTA domain-containing Ser/Thr kinase [bacterium]